MPTSQTTISCLIVDDEEMSRTIMERFVEQTNMLELKKSCKDSKKALEVLNNEWIDLLLLDIEMPEINGFELLRGLEHHPEVVLVTSKKEYALEAFDLNVVDFLLKPVDYGRFLKAVERVVDKLHARNSLDAGTNKIFVKVEDSIRTLDVTEIKWIESMADYVKIVTADNKYTVQSTMKGIIDKLPPKDFLRIHRSYIVRVDQITEKKEDSVVVDGRSLPVGSSYMKELDRHFR